MKDPDLFKHWKKYRKVFAYEIIIVKCQNVHLVATRKWHAQYIAEFHEFEAFK